MCTWEEKFQEWFPQEEKLKSTWIWKKKKLSNKHNRMLSQPRHVSKTRSRMWGYLSWTGHFLLDLHWTPLVWQFSEASHPPWPFWVPCAALRESHLVVVPCLSDSPQAFHPLPLLRTQLLSFMQLGRSPKRQKIMVFPCVWVFVIIFSIRKESFSLYLSPEAPL